MANSDWQKIKNEYISTNISYRKLAEKYNVSFNTLKDRAIRENWSELKNEQHHKIITKIQQKTAEKIAETESNYVINFAKINHLLSKKIVEMAKSIDNPQMLKQLTGALKDIKEVYIDLPQADNVVINSEDDLTIEELKKLAKDNPL